MTSELKLSITLVCSLYCKNLLVVLLVLCLCLSKQNFHGKCNNQIFLLQHAINVQKFHWCGTIVSWSSQRKQHSHNLLSIVHLDLSLWTLLFSTTASSWSFFFNYRFGTNFRKLFLILLNLRHYTQNRQAVVCSKSFILQ